MIHIYFLNKIRRNCFFLRNESVIGIKIDGTPNVAPVLVQEKLQQFSPLKISKLVLKHKNVITNNNLIISWKIKI